MNLAIISPGQNAYSETFIQAHKNIEADNVFFFYGGVIPTYLENEGIVNISARTLNTRTLINLIPKINPFRILKKKFSIKEELFAQSLKRHHIDVVLAEFGQTGVACLNVCNYLNIPLITHFHGVDITADLERYKEKYKELIRKTPYVVGVSKEMRETLISLGGEPDRVIYTPCGPNPMFYDTTRKADGTRFVCVGRFVDKKAPYYVIMAFKKVVDKYPNAILDMVGTGPLYDTCINLSKYFNLTRNINFTGVKTPNEIQELHSKAVAYVQHSITAGNGDKEGTPVGVMEASASALPVISTLHAGIKDVVINGETGLLCEEHDIDAMAKNMIWVIENHDAALTMGEKGRIYVKDNFSLEKHISILSSTVEKAYNRI